MYVITWKTADIDRLAEYVTDDESDMARKVTHLLSEGYFVTVSGDINEED